MTDPRPLASVSLDVDNLWSYMKTHGDSGWESRPTYLDRFFPPVLDALDELRLGITFFCVGIDADREENLAAFQSLAARSHEVGNHSYEHEPWLHLYSSEQLIAELARTEDALVRATGQRPIGFRGPGYSWSPALLEILVDRGYLYDASTLPTYLGPLARRYYFMTAKLTVEQRRERAALFGTLHDGLRPVTPYQWRLGSGRTLLELPVTTMPVAKVPFHLSYLLYLSRYSEGLMVAYLRTALAACRLTGTEPSFLLHPLDLMGGDQVRELAFFPGMDLTGRRKITLFLKVLRILGEHFQLVNMSTHARAILARGGLPLRVPSLPPATASEGALAPARAS
jgi:peptidoglycan/xylan/chitin deacetylase (PgdA/CDA1 family)